MILRRARPGSAGNAAAHDVDVEVRGEQVAPAGGAPGPEVDLGGRVLMPGVVNAHDHLGFSTFPPLGNPPYANVYEWAEEVAGGAGPNPAAARRALEVSLPDRLFLGGLRNVLCGVTAVVHHDAFHRSMRRPDFPVRVLERYQFAHSPGLTPALRRTYRSTDRRIPWMVHAAEGTDARCAAEVGVLREANVLRQNTVIIHGIAATEEDARAIAEAEACVVWCPESNRRLYGATTPVTMLRKKGIRIGLGSDSPVSGVRDPLSNLAAARRESVLGDDELLHLATRASAEVARLPCGGWEPGAPADLFVVDDREALLAGDRRAVALVLVRGRPVFGRPELMEALDPTSARIRVDGEPRHLRADLARRASALRKDHPQLGDVEWIRGLGLSGVEGGGQR